MAAGIWVNIGSGNGLLPDGTKPLPEPMLTYHQGTKGFIGGQFKKRYLSHQWPNLTGKLLIWKFLWNLPGTNDLRCYVLSVSTGGGVRRLNVAHLWTLLYAAMSKGGCGEQLTWHYKDVIMSVICVSNHQPHDCLLNHFIQAQIKENIKALRHWPLWGEFTGEFPTQRASNAENAFIWWCHHGEN